MYMLGIIALVFLFVLFLMCIFRDKLRASSFIGPMLVITTAVFLFAWTYAMYEHNGLPKGFMTFDNISPYICTIIPLTPFMGKKTKDFVYSGIACLGFGMFVAMFVSPEVEYLFNYHQNAKFIHASEAACHLIMGIFGFYLILSDKVKLTRKTLAKGCAFIYLSIGFGVFLNFFFHRSFFGMDMYGNYSIYFMDFFGSFEVTLIAYLLGVLFTMLSGYEVGKFIDWLSREIHSHNQSGETLSLAVETSEAIEEPSQMSFFDEKNTAEDIYETEEASSDSSAAISVKKKEENSIPDN